MVGGLWGGPCRSWHLWVRQLPSAKGKCLEKGAGMSTGGWARRPAKGLWHSVCHLPGWPTAFWAILSGLFVPNFAQCTWSSHFVKSLPYCPLSPHLPMLFPPPHLPFMNHLNPLLPKPPLVASTPPLGAGVLPFLLTSIFPTVPHSVLSLVSFVDTLSFFTIAIPHNMALGPR